MRAIRESSAIILLPRDLERAQNFATLAQVEVSHAHVVFSAALQRTMDAQDLLEQEKVYGEVKRHLASIVR